MYKVVFYTIRLQGQHVIKWGVDFGEALLADMKKPILKFKGGLINNLIILKTT
jgi:hypothetical protein